MNIKKSAIIAIIPLLLCAYIIFNRCTGHTTPQVPTADTIAATENHPDVAAKVEAQVRENLYKLTGGKPKATMMAKPAAQAVSVEADDFDDEN